MAIYHLSMQLISRSKGQSAVAAASYRSGEKLIDEATGEVKFYKRVVQPDSFILVPKHAPEWTKNRSNLWNAVEAAEIRKDSQLAREINIALPIELSHEQQKELVGKYVQANFVDKGMIADISIHRDDKNNPHFHCMLTTRAISEDGFTGKNRDWNNRELLNHWRAEWANYCNYFLESAGVEVRISHLSHEERGLELMPSIHLGHIASEMEKRGYKSERGEINRERLEYNQTVIKLNDYKRQKEALKFENEQKKIDKNMGREVGKIDLRKVKQYLREEPTLTNINKRLMQIEKWNLRLDNNVKYLFWKSKSIREASNIYDSINNSQKRINEAENNIKKINNLNPLKYKENKELKKCAENEINTNKRYIEEFEKKLDYYREKLQFKTIKELRFISESFKNEMPKMVEENQGKRAKMVEERKVLENARNSLLECLELEIKDNYPNNPEIAYLSPETKENIRIINEAYNRVVSVDEFKPIAEHFRVINAKSSIEEQRDVNDKMVGLFEGLAHAIAQAQYNMDQKQSENRKKENKPRKLRHREQKELDL